MPSHRYRQRGLTTILVLTFVVASPLALAAQTGSIEGRVADTGGAGLAGVAVRLLRPWGEEVAATVTEGLPTDGRFAFTGLSAGDYVVQVPWDQARDLAGQLYPGVPEHDWNLATRLLIDGSNTIVLGDLTLRRAASISGALGGLVGGQSVGVSVFDADTNRYRGGSSSNSATLTYTVGGLPAGRYRVQIDPGILPFARQWYDDRTLQSQADVVPVAENVDVTSVDFVMIAGWSVSGTLDLSDTPADPAPFFNQMSVAVHDAATREWVHSSGVDGSGQYVIPNLPSGRYILQVNPGQSGYVAEVYRAGVPDEWDWTRATVLEIADAPIAGIGLTLERGWALSGTVTLDTDGDGIGDRAPACASVWTNPLGPHGSNGSGTDASGAFTIVGLRTGAYELQVQACSYDDPFVGERWADHTEFESGDAIDVSADLTLPAPITVALGAEISGRVYRDLDDDGIYDAGTDPPLTGFGVRLQKVDGGCCAHTSTYADGLYRIQVPPGQYRVEGQTWNTTLLSEFWENVFFTESATPVTAPASGIDLSLVDGVAYGSLRGRVVVSETTTGIGGVDVRVRLTANGWDVAQTQTAADGTFIIAPLPPSTYLVFFDTQHTNLANGTDFVSSYWASSGTPGVIDPAVTLVVFPTLPAPLDGPGTDLGTFGLLEGGSVSGTITSPTGSLLPSSVRVWAESYESFGAPLPGGQVDLATGAYSIRGLPAPATYRVTADAWGTAFGRVYYLDETESTFDHNSATPVSVAVGADTSLVNLHLFEGGSIAGTVTRAGTGEPVADIQIDVNLINDPLGRGYWANASTRADGTYIVEGLPSGFYQVRTRAQGTGLANQMYPANVPVTQPTETPNIDFELAPGGSIGGRVTYLVQAAPRPVVNVHVRAYDYATGDHVEDAWTDANGDYAFDALPLGRRYRIEVEPREWAGPPFTDFSNFVREYYNDRVFQDDADPVPADLGGLSAAGAAGVDFELVLGGWITGVVTDALTGDPLRNLQVSVSDLVRGAWMGGDNTDQNGLYVLRGLPAGQYRVQTHPFPQNYVGEYYDDTTQHHLATPVTVPASTEADPVPEVGHIDFALTPGRRISGRVTEDDGATPVAGLPVNASGIGLPSWGNATTDLTGDYEIVGVLPGRYDVTVETAGTPYARASQEADVTDADAAGVNFALGPGASISGLVWLDGDDDGVPDAGEEVAGAQVQAFVWSGGAWVAGATSDATGRYVLSGLAAGMYRVQVEPDERNFVRLYWPDALAQNQALPVDLPLDGGGVPQDVPNVDFQLVQGYQISGRVFFDANQNGVEDPGETPVSTGVNAEPVQGGEWSWGGSDASGAYQIHGVPAGVYRVFAQAQGTPFASEYYALVGGLPVGTFDRDQATPVDATAGEAAGIDLSLVLGGGLSGVVRDDTTGTPLANINVNANAFDGAGFGFGQTTDLAGRYLITGLPPGTYRVDAWDWSGDHLGEYYDNVRFWDQATPVAVAARSSADDPLATVVDFDLARAGAIEGVVYVDTNANGFFDPGEEIADASVEVYEANTNRFISSRTSGSDGAYRVGSLPPGESLHVLAHATDYVRVYYDGSANGDAGSTDRANAEPVFVLAGGTTTGLDFALSLGGSIEGVVVDGNGTPVPSLWVNANPATAGISGGGGRTNAAGEYMIRGLSTGSYRVQTSGDSAVYSNEYFDNQKDFNAADLVSVVAGASRTNIDFRLPVQPRLLAGPAPAAAERGTTVTVTVTADRLAGGQCGVAPCAYVDFGPGVTVVSAALAGDTFSYELTIAADAPLGSRTIAVVNDFTVEDAASAEAASFTVTPQAGGELPTTGGRLYVADSALSEVRVYSTADNSLIHTLHVNGGPTSLVASDDGRFLYAGAANGRILSLVDTRLETEIARVSALGVFGTAAVARTDDYFYTVNRDVGTDDRVNVIDAHTLQPVGTIPVGVNPYAIRIDPLARWAYVANANSSSISVIDVSSASPTLNEVIGTIQIEGPSPRGVAFTDDGAAAYVVTTFGTYVIDTAAQSLVDLDGDGANGVTPIPTRGGGRGLVAIAPASDVPGRYVAYIGAEANRIRVVDLSTNRIVRTFRAGQSPNGLVASLDGTRLAITHSTSSDLYVVDTTNILTGAALPIAKVTDLVGPSGGMAIGPIPPPVPAGAPVVTGLTGSPATNAVPFEVTVTGANFGADPRLWLSGTNTAGTITAAGPGSLTVQFPADTPAGVHPVIVTDGGTGDSGVGAAPLVVQPPPGFTPTQTLYVASYCSDALALIEPDGTRASIATEPYQGSLAITPDGRLAVVGHLHVSGRTTTNALADQYYDVTVLDLLSRTRVATVPYVFGTFEAVSVTPNADNPNGIFAYVPNNSYLDAVAVIDPAAGVEVDIDDNPTTQSLPDHTFWLGDFGTKLPGITRIELDPADVTDGNYQLWGSAVTPDGSLLYVSNFGYGGDPDIPAAPAGVFVIDTVSRAKLAHLTGNGEMQAGRSLVVTPVKPAGSWDGVYVYVAGDHATLGNALFVFEAGNVDDASALVSVVDLPIEPPDRPRGIAITPDGQTVYLSSRYSGDLIVVDVRSGPTFGTVATVPVGAGVMGLAISQDDGLLYATNVFRDTVTVLDITDPLAPIVITTLQGGACPIFPAVQPSLGNPSIGAIAPRSGSEDGGTEVVIIGANFLAGASVTFDGVAASGVVVDNAFTIHAVTPAGTAGAADVRVTNPGGQYAELLGGFTYEPDTTPPVFTTAPFILSQVTVGDPGSETVTVQVRWRTDEPSTSFVEYGTGGPLGAPVGDPALVTLHVVTLPGLDPGTTYALRATSADAAGNPASSPAPPATLMFTTPSVPDVTAPEILDTPTVSVTTTTATIQWTTDEAATSLVHYDATLNGEPTLQVPGPAGTRTAHAVTLTNLVPNTVYEFRALSTDAAGNGPATSAVDTFTTAALPDTTPPAIVTGPSVSYLSNNLVIVTWTTDELSTSFINYGVSSIHEQTVIDTDLESAHIVFLTNLLPGTSYRFQAGSTDASGNTVLTADPFAAAPLVALGAKTLAAPLRAGAVTLEAGTTLNLMAATSGFSTPPEPDTTPPVVHSLTFTSLAPDRVLVTVSTDEAASLLVEYGVGDPALSRFDPTFSPDHSLLLAGLTGGTTYAARVVLTDPKGNAVLVDSLTFTTEIEVDETAPAITGVSVNSITATSAIVTWQTDEAATSEVRFGPAGQPLGLVVSALGLRSIHQLSLTGLTAGTSYEAQVVSRDTSGNKATAPAGFTTAWLPPVITSMTPSRAARDATHTVTINGQRFEAGASVDFGPDATVVGRTVNLAGTQIVATVALGPAASTGPRVIRVTNPVSTLWVTGTFTVVDTTVPVVTITDPADGADLTSRTVTVRGTVSEPATVTVNGVAAAVTPGSLDWEATIELPAPGPQTIVATAVDPSGNRGTAFIGVDLVDAGPPTLTLTATPDTLWPPNHQMVPVTVVVSVVDDTDPAPVVRLIAATSSEPDDADGGGDGATVGDIQDAAIGTNDRQLLLRAERGGGGDGRTYTLTYEAVDQAGNRAVATIQIIVPHDG